MDLMKAQQKKMPAAHESFITIRELSRDRAGLFRWYQFRNVYDAIVIPAGKKRKPSLNITIGNLLRGLYKSRLIFKVKRGLYQITALGYAVDTYGLANRKMYLPPIATLGDRNWDVRCKK